MKTILTEYNTIISRETALVDRALCDLHDQIQYLLSSLKQFNEHAQPDDFVCCDLYAALFSARDDVFKLHANITTCLAHLPIVFDTPITPTSDK